MQAVRVASAVEYTAGLLVDDLDLVVHDDIFGVALEHRIGFQQLDDRMDTLRLYGVVVDDCVVALRLLLWRQVAVLDLGYLLAYVGQHEEAVLLEVTRQHLVALVGKDHRVHLLVDDEVELVRDLGHALLVVL